MKASGILTKYVQKAQFGSKRGFEIKNEIEGQCQSRTKLIGILTVLRFFNPNFEMLAWTVDGQTNGQTEFYKDCAREIIKFSWVW